MGTFLALAVRAALAWEVAHGRTVGSRRALGGDRAAPAPAQGPARPARPTARGRPRLADRHRLRLAQWHLLGAASPGDGLRLWRDLLAPAAALAAPGRLEEAAA